MTHVKNVQAFGKLTGICTGFGGDYNPGQQNLQVNAMTTLLNSAQQAMEALNEAQTFYDNATNHRKLGFKRLRTFSSSVCNVLKASGAKGLTVKDACAINKKIWGLAKKYRKPGAEVKAEEIEKTVSGHGLDYASNANNFALLVKLVSTEPKFQPNEAILTAAGLQQKLVELQSLNETVTQAEIRLTQARRNRNELYYQSEWNLVSTAIAVKQYIRGVFGYRSSQYQEVQRLHFSKPKL